MGQSDPNVNESGSRLNLRVVPQEEGDERDERVSIVLLLDTSTSMGQGSGKRPIDSLNEALRTWSPELRGLPELTRFGEIAIITFGAGGVQLHNLQGTGAPANFRNAFIPVNAFAPPVLEAGGVTPMVEALRLALKLVEDRKKYLREDLNVEIRFRPLIWMISDGGPTNTKGERTTEWRALLPEIRAGEQGKHFLLFAIGVGSGVDEEVLRGLSPGGTYLFEEGVPFVDLLKLVSDSIEVGMRGGHRLRDAPAADVMERVRKRQESLQRMFAPKAE
jgi:uncharacterized protein YegL